MNTPPDPGPLPPTLSVVIPTFNREQMVRRCVEAVLAQTGVNLECIVVDDHSPDGTESALREAFGGDPRFKCVRLAENSLQAAARNAGARLARGEFILFLDDDNVPAPGMAAALVAALRENPGLGLAAPVSVHVLHDGRREVWTLGSDFNRFTSQPADLAPRSAEADIPDGIALFPTTYSPNAFCVPASVFRRAGGFDEALGGFYEESDFGWRVRALGFGAAIVAAARTDHFGFVEPGCAPALRALGIEKPRRAWLFARNRLWFVRRHFPLRGRLSVMLVFAPLAAAWYAATALRHRRPDIAVACLRGTLRGYVSPPPPPAGLRLPDDHDRATRTEEERTVDTGESAGL